MTINAKRPGSRTEKAPLLPGLVPRQSWLRAVGGAVTGSGGGLGGARGPGLRELNKERRSPSSSMLGNSGRGRGMAEQPCLPVPPRTTGSPPYHPPPPSRPALLPSATHPTVAQLLCGQDDGATFLPGDTAGRGEGERMESQTDRNKA